MNLLLDLDGTLTDPREGIVKSINHALRTLDAPLRDESDMERFIGPQLKDTFSILPDMKDQNILAHAITRYRERYFAIGYLENYVYKDIPELLVAWAESGHRLFVATAKRQDIAEKVLDHFGLA